MAARSAEIHGHLKPPPKAESFVRHGNVDEEGTEDNPVTFNKYFVIPTFADSNENLPIIRSASVAAAVGLNKLVLNSAEGLQSTP
ncbi:hypothetical protein G7046_g3061 [Stylonectria norvegica]|nr:hypothetical protein G7046_g3061 [Stylonectria norvegica]